MQEKVGRGEDKGGMRDGRGVDPERKVEKGASEGKARIGRTVLFCKKGSAEEKGRGCSSKNRQKSDLKRGKQEKMDYAGQKTGAVFRKIARNRVRNGEKQEKRRFRDEKDGVGER